jgi:hypothetical protein
MHTIGLFVETVRHVFPPIDINSNPILFLVVCCMLGADVDGGIIVVLSLKKISTFKIKGKVDYEILLIDNGAFRCNRITRICRK